MTSGGSSIPEVQALLRVLAAGRRCAEMGTAFGEGAAAISETAASLVTVELDPERAAIARTRLHGRPNVELLVGDWRELLPSRGPFELVFADGGHWQDRAGDDGALLIDLRAPGGLLVADDLTPGWEGPDPKREFLFSQVVAVEILTTPETAAVIATRP